MTACNVYLNVCCLHVMTDGTFFFTPADYLEGSVVAVQPQIISYQDATLAVHVR